jgi:uncharacterized protein (TIGR03663 family)
MMDENDKPKPAQEVQQFGPPWLTVETGLYLLLILLALGLRLYALGRQPLDEHEARLAIDVWRFYTGGAANIRGHSPLLFHGNLLLYLLFGANDCVARMIPALVGSLLVGLPYLLRPYLGRWGALASAVLLAFSPSFVFFSRQLDGAIILSATSLVLLASIFGYLRQGKRSHLYLGSGSVAIALMAGGAGYAVLIAVGGLLLTLTVRAGLKPAPTGHDLRTGGFETRPFGQAWVMAAGIFAALILLVSTGLFVNLQGLQATLDLLPAWLSHFSPVVEGQPWHYYLSLLVAYELPILVFGLIGACYFVRRDRFSAFLVWWFALTLILYSLMPAKPPSGLLQILLPLTLLAGKTIGELLNRIAQGERRLWDRLALLISLPIIFHMFLQLSAFANPDSPGDPRYLILVILSLFFLVSVILITGAMALDWRGSLRTAGLVVLVILAALMLQATWRLNLHKPGNPVELLLDEPTSPDVRNLVTAIEDFSNQRERDRHSVDITVTGGEDPLLAWYLRDFRHLSFVSGSPLSPTPVVITPSREAQFLPSYRGARFRVQSSWIGGDLPAHDLANWFLFGESLYPLTHRDVVLWVGPETER